MQYFMAVNPDRLRWTSSKKFKAEKLSVELNGRSTLTALAYTRFLRRPLESGWYTILQRHLRDFFSTIAYDKPQSQNEQFDAVSTQ